MLLKMYSLDSVLLGEVVLGELAGVATGVVNLYVTKAGFVPSVVGFSSLEVLGRLTVFHNVTDEYSCKLRKGLLSLRLLGCGPGVVDTFLACFFFFLFSLLCVTGLFGVYVARVLVTSLRVLSVNT